MDTTRHLILLHDEPALGGITRDLQNWTRALSARGVRCHLVFKNSGDPRAAVFPGAESVTYLGSRGVFATAKALKKTLATLPAGPVLVNRYKEFASAKIAKDFLGVRRRLFYREASLPSKYLNAYTLFRYYRVFVARADGALAQTRAATADLASLGVPGNRIHLCPNLPPDGAPVARELPPFAGNAPHLVTVGRLSGEKGYDRLIRGFAVLVTSFPQARLTIVGEGPLLAELKAVAESVGVAGKVFFPGRVDSPDAWLDGADLFVLTSKFEGLSNAFIEALHRGCRVVSTPAGGGMAALMEDLGVPDCVVGEVCDATALAAVCSHALKLPAGRWSSAGARYATDFNHDRLSTRLLEALYPESR